jgi:RNAse III (EC 3.1.26.3)
MTGIDDGALARLQRALGHQFSDPDLFLRALTHRSAGAPHYERLEFLGDAVLNLAAAEMVCEAYPTAGEGDLSRVRAVLVRESTLAELALELQLGELLRLGGGELKSGGFRRRSILADVVEALIAAVHLDGGAEASRALCRRLLAERLAAIDDPSRLKDAKTRLQEWQQARGAPLPVYDLLDARGPEHRRIFRVRCRLDEATETEAEGNSRRDAEQNAAALHLQRIESSPTRQPTGDADDVQG